MEEEGIGCSSSAVPGSPRLAKGTYGYTAPEDRMGFLLLRAKVDVEVGDVQGQIQ
jgi:hypothetical protein